MKGRVWITCPCCHGKKIVQVFEGDKSLLPVRMACCHCMGEGEIIAGDLGDEPLEAVD